MIRTRDLVVFLAVLFFVLMGIGFTLLTDSQKQETISFFTIENVPSAEEYEAEGDTRSINRQDIISRLRNALAQNQNEVEPSPSVEESEESVSEEDVVAVTPGVTYCSSYDDSLSVVRAWPRTGVSFTLANGVRTVAETTNVEVSPTSASTSSSTGTVMQSSSKTLLTLPAYPVVSGESCVPGEVVGVTQAGRLIVNSEVALYRGYGSEYLIGYARDGFPIYGFYQGAVDACGGYAHPSGYRYSITPNRDYVLGCFSGTPAPFVGF